MLADIKIEDLLPRTIKPLISIKASCTIEQGLSWRIKKLGLDTMAHENVTCLVVKSAISDKVIAIISALDMISALSSAKALHLELGDSIDSLLSLDTQEENYRLISVDRRDVFDKARNDMIWLDFK